MKFRKGQGRTVAQPSHQLQWLLQLGQHLVFVHPGNCPDRLADAPVSLAFPGGDVQILMMRFSGQEPVESPGGCIPALETQRDGRTLEVRLLRQKRRLVQAGDRGKTGRIGWHLDGGTADQRTERAAGGTVPDSGHSTLGGRTQISCKHMHPGPLHVRVTDQVLQAAVDPGGERDPVLFTGLGGCKLALQGAVLNDPQKLLYSPKHVRMFQVAGDQGLAQHVTVAGVQLGLLRKDHLIHVRDQARVVTAGATVLGAGQHRPVLAVVREVQGVVGTQLDLKSDRRAEVIVPGWRQRADGKLTGEFDELLDHERPSRWFRRRYSSCGTFSQPCLT